jgi:hypothetical protein
MSSMSKGGRYYDAFGTFKVGPRRNGELHRASAAVYPDRWLKVDRETGCVLGAFCAVAAPATRGWAAHHVLVPAAAR